MAQGPQQSFLDLIHQPVVQSSDTPQGRGDLQFRFVRNLRDPRFAYWIIRVGHDNQLTAWATSLQPVRPIQQQALGLFDLASNEISELWKLLGSAQEPLIAVCLIKVAPVHGATVLQDQEPAFPFATVRHGDLWPQSLFPIGNLDQGLVGIEPGFFPEQGKSPHNQNHLFGCGDVFDASRHRPQCVAVSIFPNLLAQLRCIAVSEKTVKRGFLEAGELLTNLPVATQEVGTCLSHCLAGHRRSSSYWAD